jgi:drug/metabolite transporter (DMT)-like permease
MTEGLSSIGLVLAGATSASNVVKEVAAKKVVGSHDLVASTVCIRFFTALVFVATLAIRWQMGFVPVLRDGGALFGIASLHLDALVTYSIYLVIDVLLVVCSTLLYYRAFQLTPISLCLPYISFTPVFLILTGYLINGESTTTTKGIGVGLICVGSIAMHRRLFARGWTAPIVAIWRERGCFFMVLAAAINAITNPIDKNLVLMADAFTQACAFGIGLFAMFVLLHVLRRGSAAAVMRAAPGWIVLAGVLEGAVLLFQLSSHTHIPVVYTISIKRAGIILLILLGWLVFKETEIADKLIAGSVMLVGVLVLYLPVSLGQGAGLGVAALAAMSAAFYFTRRPEKLAEAAG